MIISCLCFSITIQNIKYTSTLLALHRGSMLASESVLIEKAKVFYNKMLVTEHYGLLDRCCAYFRREKKTCWKTDKPENLNSWDILLSIDLKGNAHIYQSTEYEVYL